MEADTQHSRSSKSADKSQLKTLGKDFLILTKHDGKENISFYARRVLFYLFAELQSSHPLLSRILTTMLPISLSSDAKTQTVATFTISCGTFVQEICLRRP